LIHVQWYLPTLAPSCVTGELLVHVDADGRASLGWSVYATANEEPIAIGASPPLSLQDSERESLAVLQQLLRVLPTIVDAPPFD